MSFGKGSGMKFLTRQNSEKTPAAAASTQAHHPPEGIALSTNVVGEAPVDFLVKNLISSEKSFFCESLQSDYSFLSFCELLADKSSVGSQSKHPLPFAFINFYDAHKVLPKVISWTIEQDIQRGTLLDESSNKLLLWLWRMGSGHRYLWGIVARLVDRLDEWDKTNTSTPELDSIATDQFLVSKLQGIIDYMTDINEVPLYIRESLVMVLKHCNSSQAQRKAKPYPHLKVIASLFINQFVRPAVAYPLEFDLVLQRTLSPSVRKLLLQTSKICARLAKNVDNSEEKGVDLVSTFVQSNLPKLKTFLESLINEQDIERIKEGLKISPELFLYDPKRDIVSEDEAYNKLHAILSADQKIIDYNIPSDSALYARFFTNLLKHTVKNCEWLLYTQDDQYQIMYQKKDKSHDNGIMMKASCDISATVRAVFNFLHDIRAIPKTDSTAIEARVVRTYHETRRLLYIRNHMTFPLQDRDSVYMQHDMISDDETEAVLAGHSIETPLLPVLKGVERVFLLTSGFYIEKIDERKCRVTYLINLESNTPVPTSIVQMIVKQTMKTKLSLGHFFTPHPTEKERKLVMKAEQRANKVCGPPPRPLSVNLSIGSARLNSQGVVDESHPPPSPKDSQKSFTSEGRRMSSPNIAASYVASSSSSSTSAEVASDFASSQANESSAKATQSDEKTRELESLAENMLSSISVRDRYYNRELIKKCFVASQAVQWLIDMGYASSVPEAVTMGNQLIETGIVSHAIDPKLKFVNGESFYRFTVYDNSDFEELENLIKEDELNDTVRSVKENEELLQTIPLLIKQVEDNKKQIEALTQAVKKARSTSISFNDQAILCLKLFLIILVLEYSISSIMGPSSGEFNKTMIISVLLSAAISCFVSLFATDKLSRNEAEPSQVAQIQNATTCNKLQAQPQDSTDGVVAQQPTSSIALEKQEDISSELTDKPTLSSASASISAPVFPTTKAGEVNKEKVNADVRRLRQTLLEQFPEATEELYSDSYLYSVISANNRGLLKSQQKLLNSLEIRRQYNASKVDVNDLQAQLNTGSLYWFGYDKFGYPIIWVKPKLKNYKKIDVKRELEMHILMIEDAIKHFMIGSNNTFTLIADANGLGLGDFDLALMKGLVQLITNVYPDRLEALYVGPVNMFVRMVYKILSPTLPPRLMSKVHLMGNPREMLQERLLPENIPTFFKGPAVHPTFKTSDSNFSYEEMVTIQKSKKEEFVSRRSSSSSS